MTVVVVGAKSPLSLAIAKHYASQKSPIIFVDHESVTKKLETELINECAHKGSPRTLFLRGNLSREQDWKKISVKISQEYEGIEILFYLDSLKNTQDFKDVASLEVVPELVETNLFGPIFAISHTLKLLAKRRGHVVVIGDSLGDNAQSSIFRSTKLGVTALISTLRNEESKVTFSLLSPPDELDSMQEAIEMITDCVERREFRIAKSKYRETKILKKNTNNAVDVEIRDPCPLKPQSANSLCKAIFNNSKSDIKEILKNAKTSSVFEEKDADGRTALHYACYLGNLEHFNTVIPKYKKYHLVNEPDNLKFTALHLACYAGHLKIVRKLMKNLANPNYLGTGNVSPAHYIARLEPEEFKASNPKVLAQYEQTFKCLVDAGADTNQRNSDWITPVHEACKSGSMAAFTFLMRHEGDIHRKTRTNDTPLHFAVLYSKKPIIKVLLEKGADPTAVSLTGNCFDIASPDVLELLEQYREKNRRQDSDTVQVREVVVADKIEDLPPDALKLVQLAQLDQELDRVYSNWPVMMHCLRFLTKRIYVRTGEEAQQPHPVVGSRVGLNITLEEATERFVSNGNPRKMFKIVEDAGKGGFGVVYKARKLDDKKYVAIKKIPHLSEKEQWNNFDEIYFLQESSHENVVKYYNSYISRDEIWIVMEYLEGGSLSEVVARKLEEIHISYIAKYILKALKFMHKKNIAHRDLKSANVMLSLGAQIKLIDFGLCADTKQTLESMVGSPFWLPPEMIQKKTHGCPADIWSLGILCLEMATGKPPHRQSALKAVFEIGIGNVPVLEPGRSWSPTFTNFLSRMLKINPEERATADQLMEDPFIKSVNKNGLTEMQDVLRTIFLQKSLEMSLGVGL